MMRINYKIQLYLYLLPTNLNIRNGYPAQPPPETSCKLTYSNRMIVDEGVQGWGAKDAQFDANKYGSHHISHPLKPQRMWCKLCFFD